MAGTLNLPSGTKMNLAFDVPMGDDPDFNLICTYKESIDDSAFLVSVPMKDGKALAKDESQKLLFRYSLGSEQIIIAGYVDDEVKVGIRRYWKVRRVSEQRQFFQRADARTKVALKVEYMQDDWPTNYDGIIEKEDAMTLDISAGGIALFLNSRFDVGETIFITMPKVGIEDDGVLENELVAVVCWNREAPKGSAYRNVAGLQFRFNDDEEKAKVQNYIASVKKRYKV